MAEEQLVVVDSVASLVAGQLVAVVAVGEGSPALVRRVLVLQSAVELAVEEEELVEAVQMQLELELHSHSKWVQRVLRTLEMDIIKEFLRERGLVSGELSSQTHDSRFASRLSLVSEIVVGK